MIKFSFFIGTILILISIIGIPESWKRVIMGVSGLSLVLFSTYIKFYLFSKKEDKIIIEQNKEDESKASIDL